MHSDQVSGKKLLVTGGAGFIGSNLTEWLLENGAAKVRVLDNLATGFHENIASFERDPAFEFMQGDITVPDDCRAACEGIDYLFHQAALGSVPRSISNPVATHQVNSTGFLNILVAARDAKVKRVVYASSSSVYGDSRELPKKEERIGKQLSPYAVSKMTNELYGEIFATTYNMEIIGLRYFNIYGPKQNPSGPYAAAIPLFMQALLKGESPLINGDGQQTRDFTFVSNAVQANVRAMFSKNCPACGDVFNIAVGERVSLNELLEILKELTGSTVQSTYREERPGDVRDSLADISKAQQILGYHPEVRIREGLQRTLEWFKNKS